MNEWERAEPGTSRVPLPEIALHAAVTLCCFWEWVDFAVYLCLGFYGALRCCEPLRLRRRHLLLPRDLCSSTPTAFVVIEKSKTALAAHARQVARVQHVRIVQADVVQLLDAYAGNLSPSTFLFRFDEEGRRERWNALFGDKLGFCVQHLRGVTPASLRAGGATAEYIRCNSVEAARDKLRHLPNSRSTLRYCQEAVAALSVAAIAPDQRDAIATFAAATPAAVAGLTRRLRER